MSPSIPLDAETKAHEHPVDHKDELRLWLRLLTCTNLIEQTIRRRLATRFDVTLPRFDLLAQLQRAPDGLTLGELSRRMMVSNGNVTGLVARLHDEGLVERRQDPADKRSFFVSLTAAGRTRFARMAAEHEDWIADLFAGLGADQIDDLMALLARAKQSVADAAGKDKE